MNRYDFEGRVALVTGGASGIGAATAERLRDGGARVAVFDRQRREEIQNVHKQYRRDLVLYQAPRPVPTRQH